MHRLSIILTKYHFHVMSTDFFRAGNTYGTSYFVQPPSGKGYFTL